MMSVRAAFRKLPDELPEHAIRVPVELRAGPDATCGAINRVAEQVGMHPETLRSWVRRADVDGGVRSGTTTSDAQQRAEFELPWL